VRHPRKCQEPGDTDAGKSFFVTPSDSVALLAASAAEAIPYFKGGLKVSCPSKLTREIGMRFVDTA
jgi:hypothetical protein